MMKTPEHDPTHDRLTSLLRESRSQPDLPPRFQEGVWRRIEQGERSMRRPDWMEALAALVLRPRFAFAAVTALLILGALLGSLDGVAHVRHDAQERYLASVAIHAFR